MKHLILTLILACISISADAQQSLSYAYDAAGNRTNRTILLGTRASMSMDEKKDSLFFQETLAENQLKIYPNPVKAQLTISIPGYQSTMKAGLSILTMGGALIAKREILNKTTYINMSSYQPDTYILNIRLNGQSTSWKIIKQ